MYYGGPSIYLTYWMAKVEGAAAVVAPEMRMFIPVDMAMCVLHVALTKVMTWMRIYELKKNFQKSRTLTMSFKIRKNSLCYESNTDLH